MDNDAHFQSPQQSKFTRTRRQRSEVPEFLEREADLRVDAFPQRGADPDLVPDDSADEMEDVGVLDIQRTPISRSLGLSLPAC